MMNPYHDFVTEFARLIDQGRTLPLGGFPPLEPPKPAAHAPTALIFSPHPDDEVIIGALPLRLLRELKWNVINVAVTQGSNPARQPERLRELQACCHYIGFGLLQTRDNGLEHINLATRNRQPAEWGQAVDRIAEILGRNSARAFPATRSRRSSGARWRNRT